MIESIVIRPLLPFLFLSLSKENLPNFPFRTSIWKYGVIVYAYISKRRKGKERHKLKGRKIGVKNSVGYYGNAVSGDKMASPGANETFFSDR